MATTMAATMTVAPERERASDRTRTRWSMMMSVVGHALLFAWLLLFKPPEAYHEKLTEITLLDEGTAGALAAAPAAAAMAPRPVLGAAVASSENARFARALPRAENAPAPQVADIATDRIASRLAALTRESPSPSAGIATTAPPSIWGSAPATVAGPGGSGTSPVTLHRGGSGTGPALELSRGSGHGLAPALANAAPPIDRSAAAQPARGGETTARRTLAGATLMGPIADRPVLSYATPTYPEWAKHEAVEGSVTLYFIVRPDGTVRENVLIQKTAGFEDFDDNARVALRAWRFQPLRGGRTGDQWGTITFNFRLQGGG